MTMTLFLEVKTVGDDECGLPHIRLENDQQEIVNAAGLPVAAVRTWGRALGRKVKVTFETVEAEA